MRGTVLGAGVKETCGTVAGLTELRASGKAEV